MKTKALISFIVTAKLICAFVSAYAKCLFSHDAAHIFIPPVCGATDLNVETSSNFTLNRSGYLDEMDCTYTISGNGNPIVLSFSAFDLEWDFPEACNYDYLQV